MTGHNLEVGDLTKMRLNVSLVDEYGSRILHLALDHIAVLGDRLGLGRGDGGLDGELHEPLHTDVLLAGEAEDRKHATLTDSLSETLADLVLGERAVLEESLHKGIVKLGCLLDELLTESLGLVHKVRRDVKILTGSVIVLEMIVFHLEDIYEAVK